MTWLVHGLMTAVVVYWLTLFAATHLPIDPNVVVPGNDKTLHFVAYGMLGLLFGLTLLFKKSPRPSFRGEGQGEGASVPNEHQFARRFPFLGAFVMLAMYGAFDELTQPLVGRTCDIWDWLADCAGIVIGLALVAFWRVKS